jgi:hypothetical protein
MGLCPLCRGAQHLATFSGGLRYWPCSACHGAGVLFLHGHPFANNQSKWRRP